MHKFLTIAPLIAIAVIGTIYGIALSAPGRTAHADTGTPNPCGPTQWQIRQGANVGGFACVTGPQIVQLFAFDQHNAPCPEDAALIFADPDVDPKAARAGRMICINLDDQLSDHIRAAVSVCTQRDQMLVGFDDRAGRIVCAPWGTRIAH